MKLFGKKLSFGISLLISIVMFSAFAAAVFNTITWFDGSTTQMILKGSSADFDVTVDSFDPGAAFRIDLFDANDNLIKNLKTGVTDSAGFFDERLTVGPGGYGNVGGTFYIRVYSSEGSGLQFNEDVDKLTLNVLNFRPFIFSLPNVSFEEGNTASLSLDNYVFDFDDSLSSLTWQAFGNVNVIVSVDPLTHVATFSSVSGFTGSENLVFVVTDPSGQSDSANVLVSVSPLTSPPTSGKAKKKAKVHEVEVGYFGDGLFEIDNVADKVKDLTVRIAVEAGEDTITDVSNMELNRNDVVYKAVDLSGLKPGQYLARVDLNHEDSSVEDTVYFIVDVASENESATSASASQYGDAKEAFYY